MAQKEHFIHLLGLSVHLENDDLLSTETPVGHVYLHVRNDQEAVDLGASMEL